MIDIDILTTLLKELGYIDDPDDEDLTDLASVYTILTKGSVYTLSRSDSNIMSNIAAIFRY